MTKKSNKTDEYYAKLTEMILDQLRSGATTGKLWTELGNGSGLPANAVTGKRYNGSNVMWLLVAASEQGYSSNRWATYKQWAGIEGQVRKGEKGTLGVYWNFIEKEDEETGKKTRRAFMRTFSLFNLDQVDGDFGDRFDTAGPELDESLGKMETVNAWFDSLGADIRTGGDRAFYNPGLDFVQMPAAKQFVNDEGFYGVLAHECGHWTGHESRLDRKLNEGRFGSAAYAMEELVAEFTSAFVCAHLGIEAQPREDHAGYIASWIKVLENDERAAYTAAAAAAKATGLLIDLAEGSADVEVAA